MKEEEKKEKNIINNNSRNQEKNMFKINIKKAVFITITIVTLILALYGKLLTMGWITIILIWLPIIPSHFLLFTSAGILFSITNNKKILDYVSFFALCVTLLIYAFTFVDIGDMSTNKAIYNIAESTLSNISITCLIINVVLCIVLILRYTNIRDNTLEKK